MVTKGTRYMHKKADRKGSFGASKEEVPGEDGVHEGSKKEGSY